MKFDDLDTSTKIILKVILAVLILAFLWVIRDIILLLILALILASAMDPLVDYLNKKKIPRIVSILATYILVIGTFGLAVYAIVPSVVSQFKVLQANFPQYAAEFQSRVSGTIFEGISLNGIFKELVGGGSEGGVVSGTFGLFNGILSVLTVLVVSFYLVAEERGMKKFVASFLPVHHHESAYGLIEKIQKKMGLWVIGQFILSLAIFLLTWVGLSILGMRQYALVLALFAGMMEVVPYIGPTLSAIPAIFFAFIQSPPLVLAVTIMYIVIQKTEGYILVPKIMEKTVGTSPLTVLVALLVGFKLGGIVGLLIAVPLVGAIQVVVQEFWKPKSELP